MNNRKIVGKTYDYGICVQREEKPKTFISKLLDSLITSVKFIAGLLLGVAVLSIGLGLITNDYWYGFAVYIFLLIWFVFYQVEH